MTQPQHQLDGPAARRRFLIVGMARSGTTVTHQALQGHPNVRSNMDEVKVDPFFTRGLASFTVGGQNDYERDHGYGLMIDALTLIPCSMRTPGLMGYGGLEDVPKGEVLANGIKVAVGNAKQAEMVVSALTGHTSLAELAVIRVIRRDLVAQHASLQRAVRTGRWHSFSQPTNQGVAPNAPFEIPEEQFRGYCRDAVVALEKLGELRGTHRLLDLSYEDEIAALGSDAFQRVFEFLGLPEVDISWIGSKKVAPSVDRYVTNAARLYEIQREEYDDKVLQPLPRPRFRELAPSRAASARRQTAS